MIYPEPGKGMTFENMRVWHDRHLYISVDLSIYADDLPTLIARCLKRLERLRERDFPLPGTPGPVESQYERGVEEERRTEGGVEFIVRRKA